MWRCLNCETLNDGENCVICGDPKPTPEQIATAERSVTGVPADSMWKFEELDETPHIKPRTDTSRKVTPADDKTSMVFKDDIRYSDAPKKGGAGKVIAIILIVLVLLGGIGVGVYFGFLAEDPWFDLGGNDEAVEDDRSKEIMEVVENYIDSAEKYDNKGAKQYLTGDIPTEIFTDDPDECKDKFYKKCDTYGLYYFGESVIEKWEYSRKLTIKDVTKEGDKYICTVDVSQISKDDMNEILDDAIDSHDAIVEDAIEIGFEEGWIVADEDLSDSDIDRLDEMVEEKLNEKFESDIENLTPQVKQTKMTVINVNGEWKIDVAASELY